MEVNLVEKLLTFKKRDKFSAQSWEDRGLNPSDDTLCETLEALFNSCANSLIETIKEQGSSKQLKVVLNSNLSLLDKKQYDTEEKEFICDLFIELAEIVNVDINDNLNKWLYGSVLSTLFKIGNTIKSRSTIETIAQSCTKCDIDLETHIIKKDKSIPETSWLVVKCNNCKELNLLSLGPGIKETRNGNYTWIRTLFKGDYSTYEKALVRLEQIKIFGK
jgi:hypothetical protein